MNQPLCKRRSHPLWTISSWTHLPSSIATMLAHAFSTPTKVTAFGRTPSCCICWNSFSAFCPWPHLTCLNIMVVQVTTSWYGILSCTLRASFMLLHLAYMWTKLYPRKTSTSQPLWIICWGVCLPSWSAPKLAHALSTGTKKSYQDSCLFVAFPEKAQIVFSCCAALTYLASLPFHEKVCPCRLPCVRAANFASTHGGLLRLSNQRAASVILCLKSGYLALTFSCLQSHHHEGSEKNSHRIVSRSLAAAAAAAGGPTFSTLRSCSRSVTTSHNMS